VATAEDELSPVCGAAGEEFKKMNDIKVVKRRGRIFVKSRKTPVFARIAEDKFFGRTRWYILIKEPGRPEWSAGTTENLPSAIVLASAAIHTRAAGKPWWNLDWDE